jgi:hypothetical protein
VILPATVQMDAPAAVVEAKSNGPVKWYSCDDRLLVLLSTNERTCVITGKVEGVYKLYAYTGNAKGPSDPVATVVTVGKPGPGPKPPDPGPKPPVPPDPPPMPVEGKRVLILYESADLSKYPAAQREILFSKAVRDYLKAKCDKDPQADDGAAWRMWDDDIEITQQEAKGWKDLMSRPRASVPWLIVTGRGTFEGPLPANTTEMLTVLKKHLE